MTERVSAKEYRLSRDRTGCSCSQFLPQEVEAFRAHMESSHRFWLRCAEAHIVWYFNDDHIDEWKTRHGNCTVKGHKVEYGVDGFGQIG